MRARLSTMSSFNDINGVPATANRWLMTQVLREEWGFKGFVVSDYTADHELILHGYAADDAHAAQLALTAGVDMSMQSGVYVAAAAEAREVGRIADRGRRRSRAPRAARQEERSGCSTNPYRSLDPSREARDVGTPEHRALAREAARKFDRIATQRSATCCRSTKSRASR